MPLLPIVAGAPGDQFNENANNQGHPFGGRMLFADGRVFAYSQAAATAIGAGLLCAQTLNAADHDLLAVAAAVAIGEKVITVTNGGTTVIAVDDFKNGWLHIEDDAGEGHNYLIKTNDGAATGATVTITIFASIQVALTTATTVTLFRNHYSQAIVHPSPPVTMVIGVTPGAVTASFFHWQQQRGPASVLADGATAVSIIGEYDVSSDLIDGAVERADQALTEAAPPTGHGQVLVGICMDVGVDTERQLENLIL